MVAGTPSTTLTTRLPILKPGEYDLWLMRIEQYFLMTNYSLWEVILNGNKLLKRQVGETEKEYEPTTAEEKQDRRNEMKVRGTLLMLGDSSRGMQELDVNGQRVGFDRNSSSNSDSDGLGYNAASPAVESFVNSSEMLENQEYNKSKSDKGYHAVPPPYTGNFIPFKPNLTFMDEIVKSKNLDVTTVVTPSNVKKVESNHESADVKSNGDAVEPKTVRNNSFRPPAIKD
ncbi:hypothetical protein Tco_0565174 [Tanacetum coccineum]